LATYFIDSMPIIEFASLDSVIFDHLDSKALIVYYFDNPISWMFTTP